jgi:hypothetical protein
MCSEALKLQALSLRRRGTTNLLKIHRIEG